MMRAPLAPSGWPIAMAPPLTLVLARSAPTSLAQASVAFREQNVGFGSVDAVIYTRVSRDVAGVSRTKTKNGSAVRRVNVRVGLCELPTVATLLALHVTQQRGPPGNSSTTICAKATSWLSGSRGLCADRSMVAGRCSTVALSLAATVGQWAPRYCGFKAQGR